MKLERTSLAAVAGRILALAAACAVSVLPAYAEPPCPAPLAEATRLILVATSSMNGAEGKLSTFERASPSQPWTLRSGPEPVVVGKAGLGWGLTFRDKAKPGEPVKMEGDGRSPAGIFAIGATFGFAPSGRPGYIQLEPGVQICVDDPNSPAYSMIVPRQEVGPKVSGEDMPSIPLYRLGLVVDYPTSGAERSGSCIFIHIWREPGKGTAGCVAGAEALVADLQDFAGNGEAAVAILSEDGKSRFSGCLPGR